MEVTRYYKKQVVTTGTIRAIRDILQSSLSWSLSSSRYLLLYPTEKVSLDKLDEAEKIASQRGQPPNIWVELKSTGGSTFSIDTLGRITIAVKPAQPTPTPFEILDTIQTATSLVLDSESIAARTVASAFVAHVFDDDGKNYANELARFLSLLGISSKSGREFAPTSVASKVEERLSKQDVFFGIVTPHDDHTWLTQEMTVARTLKKEVFLLKEEGVLLKPGMLADHEYIPFPAKQFSKTFIPILEGLNEVCGAENWMLRSGGDGFSPSA